MLCEGPVNSFNYLECIVCWYRINGQKIQSMLNRKNSLILFAFAAAFIVGLTVFYFFKTGKIKTPAPVLSAGAGEIEVPAFPLADWRTNIDIPALPATRGSRETFADKILQNTLAEVAKSSAGSYSNFSDFISGGSSEININSGWITPYLFPHLALPLFRLRFAENPETGDYEFSGGAITLPAGGWEAGYETVPGTEEQKATIQWKKDF
ncbi:MAG: hypothetical protein WC959_01645 [Kiritimatiellales bacterium]